MIKIEYRYESYNIDYPYWIKCYQFNRFTRFMEKDFNLLKEILSNKNIALLNIRFPYNYDGYTGEIMHKVIQAKLRDETVELIELK